MRCTPKPRRSALYVPGANARALEKAPSLPCDILILDLEDAVSPGAKSDARRNIAEALDPGFDGKETLVRLNGLDTDWFRDDATALAASKVDGFVLPKVEDARTVIDARAALRASGAAPDVPLWAMVETPMGVLHLEDTVKSDRYLTGLIMGTSDLAKDLHAEHVSGRAPFLAALGHALLVARAYGLAALDGVHLDLEDDEGFTQSCIQGRQMGFDGKTLIHPKTIADANSVFAPSTAEIEEADAIIEAFEQAQAKGRGVTVLNGRLIENLHVENARRVLAMARMIEAMEG